MNTKVIVNYPHVHKTSNHTKYRMQPELDLKASKSSKPEEKKFWWGFYGQKANYSFTEFTEEI